MVYFQFLNGKRKIHDTDHKLVYSSVDTYKRGKGCARNSAVYCTGLSIKSKHNI